MRYRAEFSDIRGIMKQKNPKIHPNKVAEIKAVPESWIKFFGIRAMVSRFGIGRESIRKIRKENRLLANQIEHEWKS